MPHPAGDGEVPGGLRGAHRRAGEEHAEAGHHRGLVRSHTESNRYRDAAEADHRSLPGDVSCFSVLLFVEFN